MLELGAFAIFLSIDCGLFSELRTEYDDSRKKIKFNIVISNLTLPPPEIGDGDPEFLAVKKFLSFLSKVIDRPISIIETKEVKGTRI